MSPDHSTERARLLDEIEVQLKTARIVARDQGWKMLERVLVEAIIIVLDMRRDGRMK